MKLKQALIGTMAATVLATLVSVAPANAHPRRIIIIEQPSVFATHAPLIYEDDVTVDGAFAVGRPFYRQRLVNVWNGERWVTRVIRY